MKLLLASVLSLTLVASESGSSSGIDIMRSGSQPSRQGAAENFTGSVASIPSSTRTLRHARPAAA
jgi:hypothetical protein